MVIRKTKAQSGFETIFQNPQFKCAFITPHPQYAFGHVKEMKRHNDTDEVFVLLQGKAVLLTKDNDSAPFETTVLTAKTAYNVTKGTLHYLAVSDDAIVFVAESGAMERENTQTINVADENIII